MNDPVIVSVITAGVACIAALWKVLRTYQTKTEAKLDSIEKHRLDLLETVANLKQELGHVKGFQDGVERLAKELLKEISKPQRVSGEAAIRNAGVS